MVVTISKEDLLGLYAKAKEWHTEGFNLRGIFDCPNGNCERPFVIGIESGQLLGVACTVFYQYEKPGRTKKALRETFDGEVFGGRTPP